MLMEGRKVAIFPFSAHSYHRLHRHPVRTGSRRRRGYSRFGFRHPGDRHAQPGTCERPGSRDPAGRRSLGDRQADINALGVAAAEALAESILRAVRLAKTLGGVPGLG